MSNRNVTDSVSMGHDQKLSHRLQRGGAWIISGRTIGMAVVFGIYVLLARVMPTEGFAAFILVSSGVIFLSMAAMFGMNTLVCRFVSESFGVGDADRARTAKRLVVQLGGLSIGLVGGLSWLCLRFLGDAVFHMPILSESAGLIAVWIMLLAASQVLAEMFRGLHDLRMASLLGGVSGGLASSTLLLLGLIVTSFFGPIGFSTVVILTSMSLLMSTCAAAVYLQRIWPRDIPASDSVSHELEPLSASRVAIEAWPVMLVQLFSFGLAQLDIWVVAACCSPAELAVYGVVRRMSLLVAIPLTQLSLVVSSSISELHARGDRQSLQRILKGAATVGLLVASLPALALAGLAGPVLELVFGAAFVTGATPLRILLLGQLIYAATGPCGPALMMTGRQRISLWSLSISLPIFAIAPWAATNYGLEAVAMVFTVATSLQNIVQWSVVRVVLGIGTHPNISPRYMAELLSSAFRCSVATATST